MSLYYVPKFLYELNRDTRLQEAYLSDRRAVLGPYDLSRRRTFPHLPQNSREFVEDARLFSAQATTIKASGRVSASASAISP